MLVFAEEPKHYVSSSRGNTTVQQLKIIEEIVLSLMAEEEAWPFLKPVLKRDVSKVMLPGLKMNSSK